MNSKTDGASLFQKPAAIFLSLAALMAAASIVASLAQSGFGRIAVSNVAYRNDSGRLVRAKLLRPLGADGAIAADGAVAAFPGAVYVHGYQNNRETSDPYCIELARRGFAVLEIDALGRGNSDAPGDVGDSGFDPSYGSAASIAYLRSLPFVDPTRVGIMGHSLGAEMAYRLALEDQGIRAIVFSGFGFTAEADRERPRNALMIFGKYDEYRGRMTGTKDFEREFMSSERVLKAFPDPSPELGLTYGDFAAGTARRVYMPRTTHVLESHDASAVAEALVWMRSALEPDPELWID
ncbi:MAG: alpha/beta fold hydrolase, partial [Spirochaetaceae bacterium]|nr:alpha/beta fold hydrolase [Spirochaetaceae bacterium]